MREKAEIARKLAVQNPSIIQVDEENLPWVPFEGLWYSFDGNYSASSPDEKKRKHIERVERLKELSMKYEEEEIQRLAKQKYWSGVRQSILERDNFSCQMCGKSAPTKLHIHHILKRNEGGTDHNDVKGGASPLL